VSLVEGQSLIFRRFYPNNIMHVLHDDLIPTFVTLHSLGGASFEQVTGIPLFSAPTSIFLFYLIFIYLNLSSQHLAFVYHPHSIPAFVILLLLEELSITHVTCFYDN
jgi:hypothetical protein